MCIIKNFAIESFWVPSESMEPTIKTESRIWVEKFSLGASLPQAYSDIPWARVCLFLNRDWQNYIEKTRWEFKRTEAWGKLRRGDVLVFKETIGKNTLVKRCVALPGDTLKLKNNIK